jgi:threonylcarbamoyladenosine tRNA methylthiotransferase MtaB
MKYSIITFGCRVNQADSLGFEEALLAEGASPAPAEDADLVVVNTCSVTASADQGARQTIRRVARANPAARIVVTGCYGTRCPEEVSALPNVLRVIPNDDKPRLVPLLVAGGEFTFQKCDGDGPCGKAIEPGVAGRTAFTLRVQTGCDETCSYCIIPSTRGRPRSVPIEEVIREVERVTAAGFREIAVTGVHLGSYGRDLVPQSSLFDLLHALASLDCARDGPEPVEGARQAQLAESPVLFRISSLEPMDCSPDIVALVADHECFAPHFHLPLQHASNRVLAAMRRPYTIERYADLVNGIRLRIPHVSIGSDAIVGFPGETDEDVDALASYLEESPLTHVHVFPYSDRPGTAASAMVNKAPGAAVRDRGRRIRDISEGLTRRFRDSQIGSVHRALTLEDGTLAVTGNYLKVRIPPGRPRNEWVRVRIARAEGTTLYGETCIG